uniref:Uncharacterized protein n=1 Tax=Prymnesium polylepis TaxID=72548 RepID=A0A7S4HIE3_9EUKA
MFRTSKCSKCSHTFRKTRKRKIPKLDTPARIARVFPQSRIVMYASVARSLISALALCMCHGHHIVFKWSALGRCLGLTVGRKPPRHATPPRERAAKEARQRLRRLCPNAHAAARSRTAYARSRQMR